MSFWIKTNPIDNPSTTGGVVLRMLSEVFLFRSLFRNTRLDYRGGKAAYGSEKLLWIGSLAFHYAFFTVIFWHLKFFMEPVPFLVKGLEALDGFLQVGVPGLLVSGVALFAAAGFLLHRRIYYPQIRYISLAADYFPLFLILAIAATGILMRYFLKVDMIAVKELTMGLVSFRPKIPAGIGSIFYIHSFGLYPAGLLPLQQADARRRGPALAHPQPGQQQPRGASRKSLELPGHHPHLRGIRERFPRGNGRGRPAVGQAFARGGRGRGGGGRRAQGRPLTAGSVPETLALASPHRKGLI